MKTILYKKETRGHANHGWLDANHTFSFANYYDPQRVNFGALRVLNDDIIEGGKGFGTHPHDNMEIITIPLSGSLRHEDSMGFKGVINTGDVQVMSAGTGIHHSEFNAEKDRPTNIFQIWVFPQKDNVTPRYQQKSFKYREVKNSLHEIVTPNPDGNSLWIHQQAWFSIGAFDKDCGTSYALHAPTNGLFVMIIDGEFEVAGQKLSKRDGLGIWETNSVEFKALENNSSILLMEVPMEIA